MALHTVVLLRILGSEPQKDPGSRLDEVHFSICNGTFFFFLKHVSVQVGNSYSLLSIGKHMRSGRKDEVFLQKLSTNVPFLGTSPHLIIFVLKMS